MVRIRWINVVVLGCMLTGVTQASLSERAAENTVEVVTEKAPGSPTEETADAKRDRHLRDAAVWWAKRVAAEREGDDANVTLYTEGFTAAVQAAGPMLPKVAPVTDEVIGPFNRITFNSNKTRIDGFRFVAPEADHHWNLYWEFVLPDDGSGVQWYILPLKGRMEGFRAFHHQRNHREDGLDLPDRNILVRQWLSGGELKSGQTYLIWFSFKDDEPRDIHVRLRVFPAKQAVGNAT